MKCVSCGWDNNGEAVFCAHCGKPIAQKQGPSRLVLVTIAMVAIAVIACVAIFGVSSHSTPVGTAHVELKVIAPEYSEDDSPIPLLVEGKSNVGDAVHEVVYADANGDGGIELPAGSYNVSLVASPLCKSGRLYASKAKATVLEVAEEACRADKYVSCPDIELEVVSDDEMAPELVEQAYAAALDSGFDADKADAYRKTTQKRCDSADRNDDATSDSLHVAMDGYEFDLPEYWRGKVTLKRFENRFNMPAIGVCAKHVNVDDAYLVVIGGYPANTPQTGGDYVTPTQYVENSDGSKVVSAGSRNWPVVACEYAMAGGANLGGTFYSADDLEVLVDLATGGALTYRQAVETEDATSLTMYQIDYLKQICDSVVFDGGANVSTTEVDDFRNPAVLDVSGDANGGYATLYGVIERADMTPADTHSALGGAVYFLKLDKPVTITYNGYGVETAEYSAIQVAGKLTSTAEDEQVANHPEDVASPYDEFVGERVAVSGRILDGGSVYYVNGAAFVGAEITKLD